MRLWNWLFHRSEGPKRTVEDEPVSANDRTVKLPTEPYVFECRQCGKVFEMRRRKAACPECDSTDVELMSE